MIFKLKTNQEQAAELPVISDAMMPIWHSCNMEESAMSGSNQPYTLSYIDPSID